MFAPLIFRCNYTQLISLTILAIIVSLSFSYFQLVVCLRWTTQRIGIFIYGFFIYKLFLKQKSQIISKHYNNKYLILSAVVGGGFLSLALINTVDNESFRLAIYRCCIIFIMPLALMVCAKMVKISTFISTPIKFVGTLSLEIYLIHIYNRPLTIVRNHILSHYNMSIAITFILAVICAYCIHFFIHKIIYSNSK